MGACEEDKKVDKVQYQKLIGKLLYLSHTRPDIGFAVGMLSRFMQKPRETHWKVAHRVLAYLKGTPGQGILLKRGGGLGIEVYTDADFAGSIVDRKSTTGYCTFIGGSLVTWRSKKQGVVARSSAEAEFRALAKGICEGIWIRSILSDLTGSPSIPIVMHCDNKPAIAIAHDPVRHEETKHWEVDRHFIKEKIDLKVIRVVYVHTSEQVADILTKGLPGGLYE